MLHRSKPGSQGEEVEPARAKAVAMGVPEEDIFIEDLREEFVRDFVFPMFRANTVYEGEYLLGTSIARPLIANKLVRQQSLKSVVGEVAPKAMDCESGCEG